jgi:dCTP deaminase
MGDSIIIDPFDASQLNPNSVNLRLHDELMVYEELVLDMKKQCRVRRVTVPQEGLVLNPHQLFLGRTLERTETHDCVPQIQGRSSVARLGLFVLVTAGFGDIGFSGYWTLPLFAVQPVRIYPGIPICQISYHTVSGPITAYASDKYKDNFDIQPSLLFKELAPQQDPQLPLPFGQERPS